MSPTSKYQLISTLTWLAVVAWTLILGGSLIWTLRNDEKKTMDMAYAEAKANLNKDITFRRWVNDQGGVYVPITEKQPSIPWLSHVPGRDVTTTDGRQLTLLNPATVVRQMMDLYAQDYGIRGRITGLKYLNPGNAPDAWEKVQLEAFTHGEMKEVWAFTHIDGQPYMRYLRAMFMEPGCEKCHALLGYKLGDVRGAMGLNLPLTTYYQQIDIARRNLELTHGVIWLLGLIGIGLFSRMARRREKELTQYKTIIDSTDSAIVSQSLDGVIKSWNPGAERVFGYTVEEAVGNSMRILIPPDRLKESPEILASILRGERIDDYETVRRCKDGRLIHIASTTSPLVDKQGKVIGLTQIARDITERKKADENLHLAASVFTHALEGIMITAADGTIIDVNDAFTRITSYNRDEVLGRNPRFLKSGRQEKEFYAAMWHDLIDNGFWYGEVWNRRKNGEVYAEMLTICAVRDDQGNTQQYVALFSDITPFKEHQK